METENKLAPVTEPKKESWWDVLKFIVVTLIIVIPIRMYIAQPFIVSGASMDTTFLDGQYLIVDELSYQFRNPERGEVVIFRYPKDPSKYFIKRVIGLPGDTVTDIAGKTSITTSTTTYTVDEPYISGDPTPYMSMKLGQGQYFVMGDNRAVSFDSRAWGPVDRSFIRGRVLLRLWPVTKLGFLPGDYKYTF